MPATIQVTTPDHCCTVDITDLIARKIQESGVQSGICVIHVPHTTAGVLVNEGADPAVMDDIMMMLEKLAPWKAGYKHSEGNSGAHIRSVLVGGRTHLIIENGKPLLGTWERVFLCEFDGPRTRKIRVKILAG